MKTYGLEADLNPVDNFSDAADTKHPGYLALAKDLKISLGVGRNMFAPKREITRQEMFTLLYNLLNKLEEMPEKMEAKLENFSDAKEIDSWAKKPIEELAERGLIQSEKGKILPKATLKRSDMAVFIYELLTR